MGQTAHIEAPYQGDTPDRNGHGARPIGCSRRENVPPGRCPGEAFAHNGCRDSKLVEHRLPGEVRRRGRMEEP
jgi:hypothetical protein